MKNIGIPEIVVAIGCLVGLGFLYNCYHAWPPPAAPAPLVAKNTLLFFTTRG